MSVAFSSCSPQTQRVRTAPLTRKLGIKMNVEVVRVAYSWVPGLLARTGGLPSPEPGQYSEQKNTTSTWDHDPTRHVHLDTTLHDPVRGPRRKSPGHQSGCRHRP